MQQWQKCLPETYKDDTNSMAEISILSASDSVGACGNCFCLRRSLSRCLILTSVAENRTILVAFRVIRLPGSHLAELQGVYREKTGH